MGFSTITFLSAYRLRKIDRKKEKEKENKKISPDFPSIFLLLFSSIFSQLFSAQPFSPSALLPHYSSPPFFPGSTPKAVTKIRVISSWVAQRFLVSSFSSLSIISFAVAGKLTSTTPAKTLSPVIILPDLRPIPFSPSPACKISLPRNVAVVP